MKKALSISFSALILFASMSNAAIFTAFVLNQDKIEALFCINKAKPAMQCHGKCHLSKQLAANNDKDGEKSPLSQLENAFKVTFFHQQTSPENRNAHCVLDEKPHTFYMGLHSGLHSRPLFHPPDCQRFIC